MEEVVGSIPTKSTNYFNHLEVEAPPFRDFVASLSQIPKPFEQLQSDQSLCATWFQARR
jgi:hypothetical protein